MERDTTGRTSLAAGRPGDEVVGRSEQAPFVGWLGRHALVVDIVVVALIVLYDVMYLWAAYYGLERITTAGLVALTLTSLALGVAYVARRHSPLVLFLAAFALAWVYVLVGLGLSPAPLVLLWLFLFFLATRHTWRVAIPAVVAVGAWVVAASVPLVNLGYVRIGTVGMMVLAFGLAASLGAVTRAHRQNVLHLREEARRLAAERDAEAHVAAAQERARVARELHDIVSHGLGTMIVVADGASATVAQDPERAGTMMTRVRDTGRAAMADMRRMLGVLRDDAPAPREPQPGLAHLEDLLAEFRATGIRADLTVSGNARPLAAGAELTVFRIVQEALTNARKHGGPTLGAVEVVIEHREDAVAVRVADDGQGLSAGATLQPGHGLVGMRERVDASSGRLDVGRRDGGGFEVRAEIPSGDAP